MGRLLSALVVINHPEYTTLRGLHSHVLTVMNLYPNYNGIYYE